VKFPRNARLLRNQLDVTPFAAVFFLLAIFLMLGGMLPTPGLPLRVPVADDLPGVDQPTVTMAVDAANRLYFENQIVTEAELSARLKAAVARAPESLTLVVQANETFTARDLVHLSDLARGVGITNVLLATQPGAPAAPRRGVPSPP